MEFTIHHRVMNADVVYVNGSTVKDRYKDVDVENFEFHPHVNYEIVGWDAPSRTLTIESRGIKLPTQPQGM